MFKFINLAAVCLCYRPDANLFGPELGRFNLCALHKRVVCMFWREREREKTIFFLSKGKQTSRTENISKTVILNFQTCFCDSHISPTLFHNNRQKYGTSVYQSTNIYLFTYNLTTLSISQNTQHQMERRLFSKDGERSGFT
jgi:hypothetical protein